MNTIPIRIERLGEPNGVGRICHLTRVPCIDELIFDDINNVTMCVKVVEHIANPTAALMCVAAVRVTIF